MQERVASQILFGMGGGGQRGDAGAEWEVKKNKCQAKSSLHSMQNCSQPHECGQCLKQKTQNILWSRDGGVNVLRWCVGSGGSPNFPRCLTP